MFEIFQYNTVLFAEPDESIVEELSSDVYALEEVMRMVLEIINSCLVSQMKNNSNLIYTLLYEQAIFKPFENHPTFSDLLSNISMVRRLDYS